MTGVRQRSPRRPAAAKVRASPITGVFVQQELALEEPAVEPEEAIRRLVALRRRFEEALAAGGSDRSRM